jgi:hypothetical protein
MKSVCSVCNQEIVIREITKLILKHHPEDVEGNQRMIDWDCPNANTHLATLRRRETMKLTQEKRQEILDALRTSGKNVGEVAVMFNISSDIVADIIIMNIKDIHYLSREAL